MLGQLRQLGALVKKLQPIAPVAAAALEFAPWPGPVAKAALKRVAEAVGGDPDDPGQVEAQIDNVSSEGLVALRREDQKLKADLAKAGIDLERLRIGDVQHARALHRGSRVLPPLAALFVLGFFAAAAGAVWISAQPGEMDPGTNSLLFAILGYFSAMAQQVCAYYFGSSQSDAENREGKG